MTTVNFQLPCSLSGPKFWSVWIRISTTSHDFTWFRATLTQNSNLTWFRAEHTQTFHAIQGSTYNPHIQGISHTSTLTQHLHTHTAQNSKTHSHHTHSKNILATQLNSGSYSTLNFAHYMQLNLNFTSTIIYNHLHTSSSPITLDLTVFHFTPSSSSQDFMTTQNTWFIPASTTPYKNNQHKINHDFALQKMSTLCIFKF